MNDKSMRSQQRVHRTRVVYSYVPLWQAAQESLERAKEKESGRYFMVMSVLVFSAFCLEGYLNYLGTERLPYWKEVERGLPPKGKLAVVANDLGLTLDYSRRPVQSLLTAISFRNNLAHAKTHRLAEEIVVDVAADLPELQSEWEGLCTLEMAEKVLEDTEIVIRDFHRLAGKSGSPFLLSSYAESAGTLVSD